MTVRLSGTLEIVSIHIGNPKDITLRAIDSLRDADLVVCEDLKDARRLLHELQLQKEFLPLNEHTTKAATEEALSLLREGKRLALISDAGTPVLADPGSQLIEQCIAEGIAFTTVPGATSIIPALILSAFSPLSFTFVGFLPRDKDQRKSQLERLRGRTETQIFLEAPYRLAQIVDELASAFGASRAAAVCMDITMPTERVVRGSLLEIQEHFAKHPFKGEYVIVVKGHTGSPPAKQRPTRSHSRPRKRH